MDIRLCKRNWTCRLSAVANWVSLVHTYLQHQMVVTLIRDWDTAILNIAHIKGVSNLRRPSNVPDTLILWQRPYPKNRGGATHILMPLRCPLGRIIKGSQLVPVLSNGFANLSTPNWHGPHAQRHSRLSFRVSSFATDPFADHTTTMCTSRLINSTNIFHRDSSGALIRRRRGRHSISIRIQSTLKGDAWMVYSIPV